MQPPGTHTRGIWLGSCENDGGTCRSPPDAAALEGFFAACYQASMLREEERPATFRVLLAEVPADAQTVCRSLRMSSNNMTNCKRKKMTGSTLGCPGGRTVGTPAL